MSERGVRGMTPKRAARYFGVSLSLFNRWRCDDKEPRVPQPVEVRGVKLFLREELDAFFDQLKALRSAPPMGDGRRRRDQVSA